MSEKGEKHVHVAVLHTGWVRWELSSWLNYITFNERRMSFSIQYYGNDFAGRPCSSNRNRVVRDRPLGSDVMMIDSDIVPPIDLMDIGLLDLDVIGCPSPIWRGDDPRGPIITNLKTFGEPIVDIGKKTILEVEAIGGGIFYVSKRVMEHPGMRGAFRDIMDADGVCTMTEDYYFCQRARKMGFKIHAALGYPCGHVKETNLKAMFDMMFDQQQEQKGEVNDKT